MLFDIFLLLILFQLKHFIADFPLQTYYMLGKMQRTNWIKPLAAHAAVHAYITFLITSISINPHSKLVLILPIADFIVHFIVDRIKASPDLGGRFTPNQPYFWWILGLDQMTHHLTHYVFIYFIITSIYPA